MIQNEQGRSMIEMLGVLAIIGVLSVGGIAGYSKAMMKHKINQTISQISQIVVGIRTLNKNDSSEYGFLGDVFGNDEHNGLFATVSTSAEAIRIFSKTGVIPDEMWEYDDEGDYLRFVNSFDGSVIISRATSNSFTIMMDNVPQDACISLLTHDWGGPSETGFIAVAGNAGKMVNLASGCSSGSGSYNTHQSWYGILSNGSRINTHEVSGIACAPGVSASTANTTPMRVDLASSVCQEEDNNSISLQFR